MSKVTIQVSRRLASRLNKLVKKLGIPKGQLVTEILDLYVDDYEEVVDRICEYEADPNKEEIVSFESVEELAKYLGVKYEDNIGG